MLVLCDYATQYPEAVAMRSVDAEHVAEELVGTPFLKSWHPKGDTNRSGDQFRASRGDASFA